MHPEPQPSATERLQTADATPEHIEDFFAQGPRPIDAEEWLQANGSPLTLASFQSATAALVVRAALNEHGRCICLWGAMPDGHTPDIGLVWCIGTVEAERRSKAIHRHWPEELRLFGDCFGFLVALTHHANALHHRWLARIGFETAGTVKIGPASTDFTAFTRQTKDVADVRR